MDIEEVKSEEETESESEYEEEEESEEEDIEEDAEQDPEEPPRRIRDLFDSDGKDEILLTIANWQPPVFASSLSSRALTKYEFCQLIGLRAEQLARGPCGSGTAIQMAIQEIKDKKCPFYIKRRLPNGHVETFDINDMIINFT